MQGLRPRLLLWATLIAAASAPGFSAAGPLPPADGAFDVRAWGVADHLPGNHVNGVVQDADGFLWLATLSGLVRFDGFSFRVFDEAGGDLPSNRLTEIHLGPTGTLWLGTQQGHVAELHDGRVAWTSERPEPPSRVVSLAEDAAGNLWAAHEGDRAVPGQALVWQRQGDRMVPRRDLDALWLAEKDGRRWIRGSAGDLRTFDAGAAVTLSRDSAGDVWGFLPSGRLVRLRDGLADPVGEPFAGAIGGGVGGTLFTRDAGDRVIVFDADRSRQVAVVPKRADRALWTVDRRGLVWESSGSLLESKLTAYRGDGLEPVAEIPLRSNIRDLLEDSEGNLWVSTMTRGILRVSQAPVASLGPESGVPLPAAVGLLPDGGVFLEEAPLGICRPLHRITARGSVPLEDVCGWVTRDRGGTVWTFDESGLVGRRSGEPARRLALQGTWIVEDPATDGVLWVADRRVLRRVETEGAGGLRISDEWPLSAKRSLVVDRDGARWIGTDHGLYRLRGAELDRFGREEGLPVETVRAILPDAAGGLWLGTYGGGLVHWDGSSFVVLGEDRGLPEPVVSSLVEDGRGAVWMAGNRGVHRVEWRDLERALHDPQAALHVRSFGLEQGLPDPETTGRPGVRDDEGRLWFPTFGGVLVVEPDRLARQRDEEPRVSIVAGQTAEGRVAPGEPLEIAPSGVREVAFEYTAIHLSAPESLRFRTRLEPLDSDWIDQGAERRVRYRRLPPGEYRFRVQASVSGGTWSEALTPQIVRVLPRFHETGTFFALLAALGLALAVLAWSLATRRVRRRARELEAAVAERTVELAAERDVVTRQAARLGEIAEARADFLAAISHELRTPLTLVLAPLRDLRSAHLGSLPARAREEVEVSLRSAERLRRLVDRLLEVARSESELQRLSCRASDLVAFALGLGEELRPLIERAGSTLRFELPDAEVEVWFDSLQLETAVINLVANAAKHTPAGTTIEVAVLDDEAEAVRLVVRDDGPGIVAGDTDRIFDRFFRSSGERAAATDGFGLGLALVREVVERHHGTIELETGDAGTTFTIRLRRGCEHLRSEDLVGEDWVERAMLFSGGEAGEERGAVPAAPTPPPEDGDLDRTTILVVDDNPDLRLYVRRQLEDRYRVVEAEGGEEALRAVSERLPDLVLSDVMMPGLDGFELCREIRSDPATDFVPVVLLTARAETESRVEGLEGGADAYLAKPFDVAELRAVVDGLIASRLRLRERYAAEARRPVAVVSPSDGVVEGVGGEDRDYLRRVEEAIEAHLHDEDLGVDELARLVAQSRASLYRHVKRLKGCSPSDWIRAARLERAARMLARREGSVSEVAYAVGFKSSAHFSNCFLDHHGVRPSQIPASAPRAGLAGDDSQQVPRSEHASLGG